MTVLITGGSGFVGSLLARKLLEKGQTVKVYDLQTPPEGLLKDVEYIKGDICDRDKVSDAMRGIDVVFHSAALVSIADAGKRFNYVNFGGTQVVADESSKKGVSKFIYISSSSVYDLSQPMPLTEDSLIKDGHNDYASAKHIGETWVIMRYGDAATIIRPRTIVGEGRGGVFQILYDWIRRGKNVYIIGKGNNLFQMINNSDFCDFCILASGKGLGGVFNVGTDRYGTFRNDLEALIRYADTGSKIVSLPVSLAVCSLGILYYLHLSPLVPFHYNSVHKPFYCDIAKAKSLGWKPNFSNQEMLVQAYNWYVKHYREFTVGTTHTKAPSQKALGWLRDIS